MLILNAENWGRTYMATTTNVAPIRGGMPEISPWQEDGDRVLERSPIRYRYV
jgi:hypothetical protein